MSKQTSSNGTASLVSLAIYAALAAMYYLWQIKGMEQAGNVFIFWVWLVGIIGSILIFAGPKAEDFQPKPLYLKVFNRTASLAVVIGTIWAGHAAAATFYTLAAISMYVLSVRRKELAEAKQ